MRAEDDNEKTINEIAKKVFKGMKLGEGTKRKFLTKDDLRTWTKMMMLKNDPDQEFDEQAFSRGFDDMDRDGDGQLDIEDLRSIVRVEMEEANFSTDK